jgi:hypothetical protein
MISVVHYLVGSIGDWGQGPISSTQQEAIRIFRPKTGQDQTFDHALMISVVKYLVGSIGDWGQGPIFSTQQEAFRIVRPKTGQDQTFDHALISVVQVLRLPF